MHSSTLYKAGLAAAAAAALVFAGPLAAQAHVQISPGQAQAGAESTQLTFSVPTESAHAVTTRVAIDLPTATPFGEVSYRPIPGWSARVITSRLPRPARIDGARVTVAPTQVVWTAGPGTRLSGGQFQDFVLAVGPMPHTGRLLFPATQTYSDGTVVHWSQPTPASGKEPENPVPVLYVDDTPPAAEHGGIGLVAQPSAPLAGALLGVVLGGTALVVGVIAAVLAVSALVMARRGRTAR